MFGVATLPEVSTYEIERNKPMPSLNHSLVQATLIMCLAPYSKRYRFASELSLDLADWPSVPDLSILPKQTPDFRNDVTTVTEPPLGVIEIISPSQTLNQLVAKAEAYFGTVAQGTPVTRTFTVENLFGSNPLTLTGVPMVTVAGVHQQDFSATQPIASSLPGGSITTFTVTFTPSAPGLRSALIILTHNDLPENPFVFAVEGAGF